MLKTHFITIEFPYLYWCAKKIFLHRIDPQKCPEGSHLLHCSFLGHFAGTGKKTGQAFSVPLAAVWRLEDGRVKEVRPFYFDTKLMHDAHYGG